MFTEDIDAYFRDFGVPCSCQGVAFMGIHEQPGSLQDVAGISAVVTERSLLYPASVGMTDGATVTVDGVDYRVYAPTPQAPDGRTVRAALKRKA